MTNANSSTYIINKFQIILFYFFRLQKKSRIRETLYLSTDVNSITIATKRKILMGGFIFFWSTISFGGGPKNVLGGGGGG